MPSDQYFEELTMAVLSDADEVNGLLRRQSPEEQNELVGRMYERVAATFAQLLQVEVEKAGKLPEMRERVARIERVMQEQGEKADAAQEAAKLEAFVQHTIPHYDAFLLRAGLRIRKAFVATLTT